MQALYYLLYHQLAFTYDLVAATVSLGQWTRWALAVIPFIGGEPVLELGFGPGHLQVALREVFDASYGLDESAQMVRLARRRLRPTGARKLRLARGQAQALPFVDGAFQTLVATFPSEYAFQPETVREARRVLRPSGRLVILPAVWPGGSRMLDRFIKWLFKWTGESPASLESLSRQSAQSFESQGFSLTANRVQVGPSVVMVVLAERIP